MTMTITVKELVAELSKFQGDTEVEVMIGWSTKPVRAVAGDDEDGVYLEIDE